LLTHVFNVLWGCRHKRVSWPRFDLKRGQRGVYVTCSDCGKEIPYKNTVLVPDAPVRKK